MAITSVNEFSARGGFDADGHRNTVVMYKVETDSVNNGPLSVVIDDDLPGYLDTYTYGSELDQGSYRQSIDAQLSDEGDSWKVWDVTVVYSSRPRGTPTAFDPAFVQNVTDPTTLPAKMSGSFLKHLVEVDRDKDGNAVRNVVGDKFPNLTRTESTSDLRLEKYYSISTFDLPAFTDSGDSINSTSFFGKGVRKWLYSEFEWTLEYWGRTPFFRCTFGFETKINGDDWRYKPRNEGPRYKAAAGDAEPGKKFVSDEGLEYGDGIGDLNADGTKRAIASEPLYYDGTTAGLDPFEVYEEIDFGDVLGVPTVLPGVI